MKEDGNLVNKKMTGGQGHEGNENKLEFLTVGLNTTVFRCGRLYVVVNICKVFFRGKKCNIFSGRVGVHSSAKQSYTSVTIGTDFHRVLFIDV